MYYESSFVVPACIQNREEQITAILRSNLSNKTFTMPICLSVQLHADLILRDLLAFTSSLLKHCLGNFLLLRLLDLQRKQLEVMFYSRCCIMGSGVGILVWKIWLTLTAVVES